MAVGKKILKKRAQVKRFVFKYKKDCTAKPTKGKYYPAEDIVLSKGPTPTRNPPKLKSNITPGTILILVAGRFRGKRVVFLKQLSSGLLLVNGPYAANGVPLRRVHQKYVIATSVKVDVDKIKALEKIDDKLFQRQKVVKKKGEEGLFETSKAPAEKKIDPERLKLQQTVDKALMTTISKVDMLKSYLTAKFTLTKYDKPHDMVF